jgi:hypothetical protein
MPMDKSMVFFTAEQGNLLIRLVIAHLLADFALQTNRMVEDKKWFSVGMSVHIDVVALVTFVLSQNWQLTLFITITHWVIDGFKTILQTKYKEHGKQLFFADQFLHLIVIIGCWSVWFGIWPQLLKVISWPLAHYTTSLFVLAYVWIIWPTGYLLKYALEGIKRTNQSNEPSEKLEHGGKLIGQFERIIILTFVLLSQYEAIGFLITGKSIIRFAQNDENLRSEYILVGTMMSYAISIITGVLVNWLLTIA